MAEGINVGSVEVSVVPDARQFNPLLQAQVNPAADEAAKKISDAISKGIRDGLSDPAATAPAREQGTRAGDTFGTAFKNRVKAALDALPAAEVTLDDEAAQAKLDFLREELTSLKSQQVGVDISDTEAIARLTALRAEMDNLAAHSGSVQINVDTAAAAAQLDKFFAETTVKAEVTGDEVGKELTKSAADAAGQGSPLIMAAVGAALVAGGPAISAASILAFGGIAAVAAAQVPAVKQAFSVLKTDVMADVQSMGQEIAPTFEAIASGAGRAFNQVEPSIRAALVAVAPEMQSLAGAIEGAAETAIPAFTRAIQNGQPIIDGFDTLVRDIGSGAAGLMDALTSHAGAEGAVLGDLGRILDTLLPSIGTLLGEGAELGQSILPPITAALQLLGGVLNIVAPILPSVAAGFLAWKAAAGIGSLLGGLAKNIEDLGAKAMVSVAEFTGIQAAGEAAGVGFEAAAAGARGLEGAMGPIGWAIAGISLVIPPLISAFGGQDKAQQQTAQSAKDLAGAVQQANGAIDEQVRKQAALSAQKDGLLDYASTWGVTTQTIVDAALGQGNALDVVKQAAAGYASGQTAAATATDASTSAGMLQRQGFQQNAMASGQMLDKLLGLNGATAGAVTSSQQLAAALGGSAAVAYTNAQRLQDVAKQASSAGTEINLLKGDLDALTGKQVSMVQAQDAVIQATDSAVNSIKNQSGALVVNNDLMGTNTARAAAARESLIQLADKDNTLIGTMEQHGATVAEVTAKDGQLRDSFIKTAEQMGYSKKDAEDLATQIYGIPAERTTKITADTKTAAQYLSTLQQQIDDMRGKNIEITVSGQGGLATYTTDQRNLLYSGKADGGPIHGPGTGTSDEAGLFALSNGEHVWTAAEVAAAGGHAGVESLRQAVLANGGGRAAGGPVIVNVDIDERQVDATVASMQKQMAAATAFTSGPPTNPLGNVALGLQMASARGWGSMGEWTALYNLWQRESGWRNTAQNPTSTAYGIPQFLDSTWAGVGGHKTSDPGSQIQYGLNYIAQRYGDPLRAWAHETSAGWYDKGISYVPYDQPAVLHQGERVLTKEENAAYTPNGPMHITLQLDGHAVTDLLDGRVVHFADVVTSRGSYNG